MPAPAPVETAFIDLERAPHPLFDPGRATLALPDQPGLGFDPDPEVVERYLVARQDAA
jgi:L-alanine-DL-glutamate epimerase-like enolase superfamily enzyme